MHGHSRIAALPAAAILLTGGFLLPPACRASSAHANVDAGRVTPGLEAHKYGGHGQHSGHKGRRYVTVHKNTDTSTPILFRRVSTSNASIKAFNETGSNMGKTARTAAVRPKPKHPHKNGNGSGKLIGPAVE